MHLTVACRGRQGERLNPKKADLEAWRQWFAEALRDRGIDAEATPRRARGVTRKSERGPIRRMCERWERGSAAGTVQRGAYQAAAQAALGGAGRAAPWEAAIVLRQQRIRTFHLAQARLLQLSGDAEDHRLGVVR